MPHMHFRGFAGVDGEESKEGREGRGIIEKNEQWNKIADEGICLEGGLGNPKNDETTDQEVTKGGIVTRK